MHRGDDFVVSRQPQILAGNRRLNKNIWGLPAANHGPSLSHHVKYKNKTPIETRVNTSNTSHY